MDNLRCKYLPQFSNVQQQCTANTTKYRKNRTSRAALPVCRLSDGLLALRPSMGVTKWRVYQSVCSMTITPPPPPQLNMNSQPDDPHWYLCQLPFKPSRLFSTPPSIHTVARCWPWLTDQGSKYHVFPEVCWLQLTPRHLRKNEHNVAVETAETRGRPDETLQKCLFLSPLSLLRPQNSG